MTTTTFKIGDRVDLTPKARGQEPLNSPNPNNPEDAPYYATFARGMGPGPFLVADLMPVSPRELERGEHPQRIKVRFPDGSGVSDWISGGWFQLVQ